MPSTDIKDYYRRSWGIGDRQPFGSGASVDFSNATPLKNSLYTIRLTEDGVRTTHKGTESEIKEIIETHNEKALSSKSTKARIIDDTYIKNYKWTQFLNDLDDGKTLNEIAKIIYSADVDFYKSQPKSYYRTGKKKGTPIHPIQDIRNYLSGKLDIQGMGPYKNKASVNLKKTKVIQKKGIAAAKKWIADNGPRFKKEGHLGYFRKAFFDFMKANYPTLVKTAGTGTKEVIAGTQYINESAKAFGQTGAGIQKNIGAINNALKTALGIPLHTNVAKSAAEITKNWQKYYKVIEELLPTAQKNGVVDTHFTHARTGKPVKITSKNYMTWLKSSQTDVMKKIFNDLVKFSVEHTGGMKRAKQLMDSDALGQIIAQEHGEFLDKKGRKITANLLKGKLYDKQIDLNINKAKNEAITLKDKKIYINKANEWADKAQKKYGVHQTKYKVLPDKTIKPIHSKISLNDTLVSKTKNSIHTFIANDGMKREVWNNKKFPSKLKKAIVLISEGKNADKIISSHLDDVIPNWTKNKGLTFNSFAGALDLDVVPLGLRTAIGKSASALGKSLKVLGWATAPLDVIPFVQARDLGIDNWGAVGGKNLAQDYLNLPRTIEDLFHVATDEGSWKNFGSKKEEDRLFDYEPRTFGTKSTVKALRGTSTEDLIASINAQAEAAAGNTGVAYGQQVDATWSKEKLNNQINKALKQKEWADSLSEEDPLVKEEIKEKTEINETDNIFGTEVPTKNLTGVDIYKFNRGI